MVYEQCWCDMTEIAESKGYDDYIAIMAVKNDEPSCKDGMMACPYAFGTDERKAWVRGWNRARGDK